MHLAANATIASYFGNQIRLDKIITIFQKRLGNIKLCDSVKVYICAFFVIKVNYLITMAGYFLFVLLVIAVHVTSIVAQENDQYKICALEKFEQECQQLERSNKFYCDKIKNNIECILDINNKLASFGVISADEAALAAPLVKNVNVIGEIRPADRSINKTEYDIVVLTRINSNISGPKDVKDKKLCHPGFGNLETTDFMLEEFTDRMISANGINLYNTMDANTMIERKIKALADLFGPSCRPGPWVSNKDFDKKLKESYPILCSICPNETCTSNSASSSSPSDPFRASLECLLRGHGDIAITTQHTIVTYLPQISRNNYRYYCPNDGTSDITLPCKWSRQPWRLLIANKDESERSQALLKKYLPDILVAPDRTPYTMEQEAQYIKKIIMETGEKIDGRINITTNPINLKTYMKEFRQIPDSKISEHDIRWCVTSKAELEKCNFFELAYANQGIMPPLRCVEAEDQLQCLDFIKNNQADIVVVPVRYGFIGRRKNLTAVAYPETKIAEKIKTMIVLKANGPLDDGTELTRFENMKDKKGCFPEYGGVSWFSWIDIGRQLNVLPNDSCDYGKLTSDFLSKACLPGAKDGEHEVSVSITDTDKDRMCELCRKAPISPTATNCNADEGNAFFNVTGALKCLDEIGDFAVIGLRNDFNLPNLDKYKVLCRNNSLASFSGLNIDEECTLSTVIDSEVLIRRGDRKHDDIKYVLEEIEFKFTIRTPFEVFNRFNKTLDLLFLDSTPGLAFEDSNNKYVRNYVELTSHFDDCVANAKGKADHLSSIFVLSLFLSMALVVKCKCLCIIY